MQAACHPSAEQARLPGHPSMALSTSSLTSINCQLPFNPRAAMAAGTFSVCARPCNSLPRSMHSSAFSMWLQCPPRQPCTCQPWPKVAYSIHMLDSEQFQSKPTSVCMMPCSIFFQRVCNHLVQTCVLWCPQRMLICWLGSKTLSSYSSSPHACLLSDSRGPQLAWRLLLSASA